jgi:hypothetical protein
MNITNDTGVQIGLSSAHQLNIASSKKEPAPTSTPSTPEILSSTVSISGQALLKQRIFDGSEPRHRPLSVANTSASLFMNPADFLTKKDCQMLERVYTFTQESGADLMFADDLGQSLAEYRSLNNGQRRGPHNDGTAFDSEGHMVSYSFLDKDAVTTQRILASEALKTTELDLGFIRYKTDVKYSATAGNQFEFLEQVINKFSAKGDDVPPLDARFSRCEFPKEAYKMHLSAEKYELGPNGPVRKGTAAANANDPLAALGKNKKKSLNARLATPETLRAVLRQIMAKAMGTGVGLRMRSLAEFLMRSGR